MNVCILNINTTGNDPEKHQILKIAGTLYKDKEPVGNLDVFIRHKVLMIETSDYLAHSKILTEIEQYHGQILKDTSAIKSAADMRYMINSFKWIPALLLAWFDGCGTTPTKFGGYNFKETTYPFINRIFGAKELGMKGPFIDTSTLYALQENKYQTLDCRERTNNDAVSIQRLLDTPVIS